MEHLHSKVYARANGCPRNPPALVAGEVGNGLVQRKLLERTWVASFLSTRAWPGSKIGSRRSGGRPRWRLMGPLGGFWPGLGIFGRERLKQAIQLRCLLEGSAGSEVAAGVTVDCRFDFTSALRVRDRTTQGHGMHDLQVCENPSGPPGINDPRTRTEGWEGAVGLEPDVVALCAG